jgi:hypothetical protein
MPKPGGASVNPDGLQWIRGQADTAQYYPAEGTGPIAYADMTVYQRNALDELIEDSTFAETQGASG